MLDPNNEFIIDAVAHPYNHSPENYRDPEPAGLICEMAFGFNAGSPNPECVVPHDAYISDWSVEDTANVLFRESPTDLAVVHTLPFDGWFKERNCLVEKSLGALQRWPNRVRARASVDPLQGKAALNELDRQVELLNPIGLEAFCEYLIPEDLLEEGGLLAPIEQISDDVKRNILAGNWARLHGLDIEATKEGIADDEFSRARKQDPNPQPWSTTSKWSQIEEERRKGNPAFAHDLAEVPAS